MWLIWERGGGSGPQTKTNSCTRWRRWKTPVSMHRSSSKIPNSSPKLSDPVATLKNRGGVLCASSTVKSDEMGRSATLRGRQQRQRLQPSLSTVGCVRVLSTLPKPAWVHTLSYPSRPTHPPDPLLKNFFFEKKQSLTPSKLWRANVFGQWRLHELSDLNLKVGRLRSNRRLTCPPLPPTRDHARLSSTAQNCVTRASVDANFVGRALSAQPVILGDAGTGRHSLETC